MLCLADQKMAMRDQNCRNIRHHFPRQALLNSDWKTCLPMYGPSGKIHIANVHVFSASVLCFVNGSTNSVPQTCETRVERMMKNHDLTHKLEIAGQPTQLLTSALAIAQRTAILIGHAGGSLCELRLSVWSSLGRTTVDSPLFNNRGGKVVDTSIFGIQLRLWCES